jgi:hypothetical protein
MTGTRQRTYSRQVIEESRAAWDAGDFSAEWKPWRHMAAMVAGIIYPPDGTKWDSWGDDSPSQRAMLVKAMRESPEALRAAIRAARRPTWSAVLDEMLRVWGERGERVDEAIRDNDRERADDITHQQAKDTLRRIGTVLGRQDRGAA